MTPVGAIMLELMDTVDPGVALPESLCRLAVVRLPVSAAGIALIDRAGAGQLVAASDERAIALEHLQFTLGEGPCLDAMRTGRLVQQPSLAATGPRRWPVYTEAVIALGVAALFSFSLRVGGIHFGVLDLFADEVTYLDDADLTTALHLVDAAILIVMHLHSPSASAVAHHDDPAASMVEAFHASSIVHQATGMVAVQAGVTLGDALLLLRAYAYSEQRSVVDVAGGVLDRTITFR